jgi:hypothetical protein
VRFSAVLSGVGTTGRTSAVGGADEPGAVTA